MSVKAKDLPSAIHLSTIIQDFQQAKGLLFLDFDGTLSPIVQHFDDAALDEEMHDTLRLVSDQVQTSVISGRDLFDVKKRINIDSMYYSGSHGMDILYPDGYHWEYPQAKEKLPTLDKIESELREECKDLDGVFVERKRFAIAVHFRNAAPDSENSLKTLVDDCCAEHEKLKVSPGKKIIEIKPDIDWHKGKALQVLEDKLKQSDEQPFSIYIGDDVTDEDAFAAIKHGAGILVGDHGHETSASFSLKDTDEVKEFLGKLLIK